MKLTNYIIIVLSILLFSCGSSRFVKNPPFKIIEASYCGEANNTGTLHIKFSSEVDIEFEKVYFRNQYIDLKESNVNDKSISVSFDKKEIKRDLILSDNPTEELYNNPPLNSKSDLKKNEIILSYSLKNTTYCYKFLLSKTKK